jgi:hypothetical protein
MYLPDCSASMRVTPEEMEAIKQAEIPAQYAQLDDELKDWMR